MVDEEGVRFSVIESEPTESVFHVEDGYESIFLNHLQALNDNITNVESRYTQIKKELTV